MWPFALYSDHGVTYKLSNQGYEARQCDKITNLGYQTDIAMVFQGTVSYIFYGRCPVLRLHCNHFQSHLAGLPLTLSRVLVSPTVTLMLTISFVNHNLVCVSKVTSPSTSMLNVGFSLQSKSYCPRLTYQTALHQH